ncbi:hypothetical protein QG37_03028 [Candidozyma auris]|uniref:Uncharacterized protein n=1 Tax=Candidozyma auris TaxID=498019 RepID=A0A0L0P263_CANAR|nr:hypothetical protein QG37_03028 [[Candida] auris]
MEGAQLLRADIIGDGFPKRCGEFVKIWIFGSRQAYVKAT